MAFRILKGSDRVSRECFTPEDVLSFEERLKLGLNLFEEGTRNAIRETYACVPETDDFAGDWKYPHHSILDGDVILNLAGLEKAAEDVAALESSDEKTTAAAHIARHYRELDRAVPDAIESYLNSRRENKRGIKPGAQMFTLDAGGKPVDLSGNRITPRAGSVMGMVCYSRPGTGLNGDPTDVVSLASRKEKWPDGRDDNDNFLHVTYRALSAGIVNADSWPIDFSKPGVLKKATRFLIGRPFLKDHWKYIDDQIGSVRDTLWDEGDAKRSAGINALVRVNLNAPQSANVAPLIEARDANAVSVTVWYEWEKSHKDMDDHVFFDMWGEEVDDELVRPIATKILDLTELSQVWDGADPDAKRIEASASKEKPQFISSAVGVPLNTDGQKNRQQFAESDEGRSDTIKESRMLDKLKKALAKLYGVDTSKVTEEFAGDIVAGSLKLEETEGVKALLAAKQSKTDEYLGTIETRDTEIKSLTAKIADLEKEAELGKKYLADIRADAAKFYKTAEGDEASKTILEMLDTASLEQAIALRDKFEKEVKAKFALTCNECGSEDVDRANSLDAKAEGDDDADEDGDGDSSGDAIELG